MAGLALMKRVLTPLAKLVLLPLELSTRMSATEAAIQKKKKKKKKKTGKGTTALKN